MVIATSPMTEAMMREAFTPSWSSTVFQSRSRIAQTPVLSADAEADDDGQGPRRLLALGLQHPVVTTQSSLVLDPGRQRAPGTLTDPEHLCGVLFVGQVLVEVDDHSETIVVLGPDTEGLLDHLLHGLLLDCGEALGEDVSGFGESEGLLLTALGHVHVVDHLLDVDP